MHPRAEHVRWLIEDRGTFGRAEHPHAVQKLLKVVPLPHQSAGPNSLRLGSGQAEEGIAGRLQATSGGATY